LDEALPGFSTQIHPAINNASAAGKTYQAMRYKQSWSQSAEWSAAMRAVNSMISYP